MKYFRYVNYTTVLVGGGFWVLSSWFPQKFFVIAGVSLLALGACMSAAGEFYIWHHKTDFLDKDTPEYFEARIKDINIILNSIKGKPGTEERIKKLQAEKSELEGKLGKSVS
jgi:hypothetical protein